MIRRFLAFLPLAAPLVCFSQTEMSDSAVSIGHYAPDSLRLEAGRASTVRDLEYRSAYSPLFLYTRPRPIDLHLPELQFTPGQARLFEWNGGAVVASGGSSAFPGLMQIDSGTLGVVQSVGNFTFYAGGVANKYGSFNSLHTQYGLSGSISYQFSPRLSATVFGDYYFGKAPRSANGLPMPPAMIGYYGRSNFGGYLDYQINERWGVQTGVQTVQQIGTGKYEVEPIVTPYYKISKKVSIGLPVGQILYHVLKK